MTLTVNNNVFHLHCNQFEAKKVPRTGFKWDKEKGAWITTSTFHALMFRDYADSLAKIAIQLRIEKELKKEDSTKINGRLLEPFSDAINKLGLKVLFCYLLKTKFTKTLRICILNKDNSTLICKETYPKTYAKGDDMAIGQISRAINKKIPNFRY